MTIFDTKSLIKQIPKEDKNALIVAANPTGAKVILRIVNDNGWQVQGEGSWDKITGFDAKIEGIYSW